jgi:hypothetical protein
MNSQPMPETTDYDTTRLIERPDGFYWQLRHGGQEYGPFPTLLEAVRDMQYRDDNDTAPDDILEAAESDLGIADWIDEETGEPGEDNAPRLDEH